MKTKTKKPTYKFQPLEIDNYKQLSRILDETILDYCIDCKLSTYKTQVGFYGEFKCLKCGRRE